MATARVQVNPDAVGVNNVAVIVAPADKMRDKAKVASVGREPADLDTVLADALKAEKALDKDGNEVAAVIDAPVGTPAAVKGGDMTRADLEAGGKKPAAK